jgi:hypothetical protein
MRSWYAFNVQYLQKMHCENSVNYLVGKLIFLNHIYLLAILMIDDYWDPYGPVCTSTGTFFLIDGPIDHDHSLTLSTAFFPAVHNTESEQSSSSSN